MTIYALESMASIILCSRDAAVIQLGSYRVFVCARAHTCVRRIMHHSTAQHPTERGCARCAEQISTKSSSSSTMCVCRPHITRGLFESYYSATVCASYPREATTALLCGGGQCISDDLVWETLAHHQTFCTIMLVKIRLPHITLGKRC